MRLPLGIKPIDELEAGENLDMLVAEKIFRWTRVGICRGHPMGIPEGWGDDARNLRFITASSVEMLEAWKVVEELSRGGWSISLSGSERKRWWCVFDRIHEDGAAQYVGAWADVPALAICRAALKAHEASQ